LRVKILRLKADGFGALRGEFSFDPKRATIVLDDNERGKSTLLAAIEAGLYGLDDDRRQNKLVTPLDRWRPWDGGPYRVTLEVEDAGRRLTIQRDFDRGTVEVVDDRGREVTAEFKEGKDDYLVGKKLLGLDADEFRKCAFMGQGDLSQVVPAEEKLRRGSTLRARLENAADTRVGDTNASEALKVLEAALRRYNSPEVEFTGTVENAIQRLETKRGLLETEIKTLEHDHGTMSAPREKMAALGEREREAREALARLDAERRGVLAADVRAKLEENRKHREELDRLRAEIDALAHAAHLPANAEADFRDTIARLETEELGLKTLETRRQEQQGRERAELEQELAQLSTFASCTAADADQAVAIAAELRRVVEEDSQIRDEVFSLRESLASKGHEPERIQWLSQRFGKLGEIEQRLLRGQSEVALAFQTEVAQLEQMRTMGSETLREIDGLRARWRTPGWLLLGLGVAGAAAGGVLIALSTGGPLGVALAVAGGILLAIGIGFLITSSGMRTQEREEALRQLTDAQSRLNQMRTRRAEAEVGLADLSRRMGYRDAVELQREWGEYARLMEESAPALRAQERISELEARRRRAGSQARELLDRFGGGNVDAGKLEALAADMRRVLGLRQRISEMERNWSWMDDERRLAEAKASGLKERALRTLQSAGLGYDPDRPWADHAQDLAERLSGKARYSRLVDELIPQAELGVLSEEEERELQAQAAAFDGVATEPRAARPAIEIENERKSWSEKLDEARTQREDLRVKVEEESRRYAAEHPKKVIEKERIDDALGRARRFKHAIDLTRETIEKVATETHRRWADQLNARVPELLQSFGARIEQLRFGDDLDFSVKLAANGQQVARAKADQQLSTGARDQLYFAVRLGIAEFLSRGQSALPLLFDDPFATSDDERARAGMKLLLEHFSREHQVIVLTCHKRRYETLADMDRDLYGDKVRWVTLNKSEVAR
jgi:uncharacterized protein YhaN